MSPARLLLARHSWEQEIAFARAAVKQIDRQIAELDAQVDAEDDGTVQPLESPVRGTP